MSKANKILIGLLALQLLVTGYLYRDTRQGGGPEVALLPGLAGQQIGKMVISESKDKSVTLQRSGDVWQVELAPGRDYPADASKVDAMLKRLAGLKSKRLVSRTKGGRQRLKVTPDQYNRKVEVETGKGSFTLYLGTAPSYQSIHARAADSDDVYLVRDLALWEVPAEAAGWWQTHYLDQDPKQLLEVELVNRQGRLHLQRGKVDEPWQAADGRTALDPQKTQDLLGSLSQLTINQVVTDPSWRPKGEPVATLKMRDGKGEAELKIWTRPDEKSDYTVKVDGLEFYAKAGSYAVGPVLNAKLADLQGEASKPVNAKSAAGPENPKPAEKRKVGAESL